MNASRFVLPTLCAVVTLLIILAGPSFFKKSALPPTPNSLADRSLKVSQLVAQAQGAAGDLDHHLRELTPQLTARRGDAALQSSQEIHDTLVQLAERQRMLQEQVQATLAGEKEKPSSRSGIETVATLAGFCSTVLTMLLSWRADRRDKQRLHNEVLELKAKLAAGAH